jgi:hypothetical protein
LTCSEVSTSTLVDSLGAIDRFYELSIRHAFWRYLVVGGYVSHEVADDAASTLVDERIQERGEGAIFLRQVQRIYRERGPDWHAHPAPGATLRRAS